MENKELDPHYLTEENIRLTNELNKTKNELCHLKESTRKMITLLNAHRNDITEIMNDMQIIYSLKIIDDSIIGNQYDNIDGVEERKDNNELIGGLRLLTESELEERENERENGKIMNFFGINYVMN